MPRNGSGSFAAAASSVNPAVASTTIEVAPFNTLIDDIESGLSESIARDGQTAATARIPFASGISSDTITEVTGAAGVTIDSVLLKDGGATLSDSVTYIADNADATKKFQFQVSGVTTATTRVLTVPNFDGTIATIAGTETLTNKTLTSPTITTPTVDLSAVTSAGDLAVANGGTGAGTFTDGGVLIGNGTNPVQVTTAGTSGHVLTSNGAGNDPTFQAIPTVSGTLTAGTSCTKNPYAGATQTTQAHGLGAIPSLIDTYLECVSGEHGYSIGDRVQPYGLNINTDSGWVVHKDATNLIIITASNVPYVLHKTTSAVSVITAASWKVVATPFKVV